MDDNTKLNIQIGTTLNPENIYVEIVENGPYILHGKSKLVQQFIVPNSKGISVNYKEGEEFETKDKTYFCYRDPPTH